MKKRILLTICLTMAFCFNVNANDLIAPSEEYILERVALIDTITDLAPVTEDHDPNEMLHKEGGYEAVIFFADSQVDRSKLYIVPGEDNVIDIATDGGGAVEVYADEKAAKERDDYLAKFDNTMLDSGSHTVYGSCVIRTSCNLTKTQQKTLETKLITVLTADEISDIDLEELTKIEVIVEEPEIEGCLLYDQDGYQIYCQKYDKENPKYDNVFTFYIKNDTTDAITIKEYEATVNGITVPMFGYFTIFAKQEHSVDAFVGQYGLDEAGITAIEDITFDFEIYDGFSDELKGQTGPLSVHVCEDGTIEMK